MTHKIVCIFKSIVFMCNSILHEINNRPLQLNSIVNNVTIFLEGAIIRNIILFEYNVIQFYFMTSRHFFDKY